MNKKIIEFDCNVLNQILSIPSDGDRYFNTTYWNHRDLDYPSYIRTIYENDGLAKT